MVTLISWLPHMILVYLSIEIAVSNAVCLSLEVSSNQDLNSIPDDVEELCLTFNPQHTVNFVPGLFPYRNKLTILRLNVTHVNTINQGIFDNLNITEFLTILKVANQPLKSFENGAFRGLVNLVNLFLDTLELETVAPEAFYNLPKLISISFRRNSLTQIPTMRDSFDLAQLDFSENKLGSLQYVMLNYSKLAALELNSNSLTGSLEGAYFRNLNALQILDLRNNQLTSLHSSSTQGLNSVTSFLVSNNRITQVDSQALYQIRNVQELHFDQNELQTLDVKDLSQVTYVTLSNNPWRCDCDLSNLLDWLVQKSLATDNNTTCREPPALAQRTLQDLIDKQDLAFCRTTTNTQSAATVTTTSSTTDDRIFTTTERAEVTTNTLSGGQIVGIVIGSIAAILVIILLIILIWLCVRRRCFKWWPWKKDQGNNRSSTFENARGLDGSFIRKKGSTLYDPNSRVPSPKTNNNKLKYNGDKSRPQESFSSNTAVSNNNLLRSDKRALERPNPAPHVYDSPAFLDDSMDDPLPTISHGRLEFTREPGLENQYSVIEERPEIALQHQPPPKANSSTDEDRGTHHRLAEGWV